MSTPDANTDATSALVSVYRIVDDGKRISLRAKFRKVKGILELQLAQPDVVAGFETLVAITRR